MSPQRLKIIACGVFEDELRAIAARSANELDVELLDAGLHAAPDRLRLEAQEAIDRASQDGFDAVCLAYGLCGRGTAGLVARDVPVVIPRAHDCISLLLGSPKAYRREFARHPGTFYFTTGWFKHKAHPDQARIRSAGGFDPQTHPHFGEFAEQYGTENARYIVRFLESWRRNYTRAALVDHGYATAEHEKVTRAVADAAGWRYERLEGSLAFIEDMAAGRWDEELFLVLPPGHMAVTTNDERVLAAVPAPEGGAVGVTGPAAVETGSFTCAAEPEPEGQDAHEVGLGIDAGGTYTDAVLFEFSTGAVLDKAKAPTTHHDLLLGITEALDALNPALFGRVDCVSLSSTLATNAVVEGRGRAVGLLVMPYHEELADAVRTPLVRRLSARMTIEGIPQSPVEPPEVVKAAEELVAEGAQAFAVSGYGAVRNPLHELEVRRLLEEHLGMSAVCGHELSGELDFVSRAHTAVLNARLVPIVEELLDAVERALAERGLQAPLFVVRGDGSVMQRRAARRRAVDTVLSGPAASGVGGLHLTDAAEALVVDMGGTTTDVAAVADGRLALSETGAEVGGWRTCVAAADVLTVGLGGDSAVRADGAELTIGPRRVLPLCMMAERYPGVLGMLEKADAGAPEFLLLSGRPADGTLAGQERRMAELLSDGPMTREALCDACGAAAPELLRVGRLEAVGLLQRASVTPTDALHVLGVFTEHDAEAAGLALAALGRALDLTAEEAARRVRRAVERRLALMLMRRELTAEHGVDVEPERALPLLERALEDGAGRSFELAWRQNRPVVGIGAPVAAYLPGACAMLGAEPTVPPNAEVAGAVGAAATQVRVRVRARVRTDSMGHYVVYCPTGVQRFGRLPQAVEAARREVVCAARRRAERFGTRRREVEVRVTRRTGRLADGSAQLIEIHVEALVEGRPKTWRARTLCD
ncbi:MAG: DUF1638 domain-containing protein [Candidatus Brocadiia bacterium]